MSLQSNRAGRLVGLAVGLVSLTMAARAAQAHILLTDPKPRDNIDTHKSDATPCQPARTATQPVTMMDPTGVAYAGGATITVKFAETTNHPGCFAIDIAPADDKGWVMLGTVKHMTAPRVPRPYMTTVKLPDGMACDKCTLRVRQFMLPADPAVCPPPTVPAGQTYFQCANVVLKGGGGTEPDGGAPMDGGDATGGSTGSTGGSTGSTGGSTGSTGGSTGSTGGTTGSTGGKTGSTGGKTGSTGGAGGEEEETGGTGGGKRAPSGGCSVGGPASGGGLLVLAALALIVRRRRR
jgi:MYXO-CTERM domain-containing protein